MHPGGLQLEPGRQIARIGPVVWLVGTGEVRPEEVLGLTFTRKAAAELSLRVRSALELSLIHI